MPPLGGGLLFYDGERVICPPPEFDVSPLVQATITTLIGVRWE